MPDSKPLKYTPARLVTLPLWSIAGGSNVQRAEPVAMLNADKTPKLDSKDKPRFSAGVVQTDDAGKPLTSPVKEWERTEGSRLHLAVARTVLVETSGGQFVMSDKKSGKVLVSGWLCTLSRSGQAPAAAARESVRADYVARGVTQETVAEKADRVSAERAEMVTDAMKVAARNLASALLLARTSQGVALATLTASFGSLVGAEFIRTLCKDFPSDTAAAAK